MPELWIELPKDPDEIREIVLDDQGLWQAFWTEHAMQVTAAEPLKAVLRVHVQDGGCFVEGALTGAVVLPCDRCAADVRHDLYVAFEAYEALEDADAGPGESILRQTRGGLELDAAGLAWQQFVLDLPPKTLCAETCKGLCARCGKDLNDGPCDCGPGEGDPRLSALRGLKVSH